MLCPFCKKEIREESKFCAKCGKKIPRCPTCQKVVYEQTQFCVHDGTPLPDETIFLLSDLVVSTPTKSSVPAQKTNILIPILIAFFAAVLVGGIGCLGYSILSGNLSIGKSNHNESIQTVSEQPEREDTSAAQQSQTAEKEHQSVVADDSEDEELLQELEEQDRSGVDPIEYFVLNSDCQYFTEADLEGFDAEMCRLARNGIYARMGRKFQDQALTDYFLQYSWYAPTINPNDFTDAMLNEYQAANRDLIVAYETKRGFR